MNISKQDQVQLLELELHLKKLELEYAQLKLDAAIQQMNEHKRAEGIADNYVPALLKEQAS